MEASRRLIVAFIVGYGIGFALMSLYQWILSLCLNGFS
jgi:hypothetical protein